MTKRVLVWDDVIDIFIVTLAQKAASRNKGLNSEQTFQSQQNTFTFMTQRSCQKKQIPDEDLVNVSSGPSLHDDEFKVLAQSQQSAGKVQAKPVF